MTARTLSGMTRVRCGQAPAWFTSVRLPGRLGHGPEPRHVGELVQTRAHPAFRWMERRAMRSSSVPGSEGFGDHPDQYTGDPVWRLRVPGADAAPGQGLGTRPIGPAHSKHWPRSGRPGVRREYDHQPDAPAASCVAPCAFAAVRDITGRMLLVRRCDTGDWELPGGHVDPGESASDAAVRETAEESGITVEITGLVGIYTDPGHVIADPGTGLVRQPFAVCFHARPLSGSPGGDQVETSDARWFTIGEIPALPIRPAMRLRIDHALTPGRPCHIG